MKIIFLIFSFFISSAQSSVTWEQQAEQLQKISVSLVEAIPVSTPIRDKALDFYAETSLVPKPNPRIGGKNEDTKTPPVHMIPAIRYNRVFAAFFSGRIWGGMLPPFVAGLFTKHEVFQVLGGVEGQIILPHSFFIPIGSQLTYMSVKGHISSKDSQDTLNSIAASTYTGFGQDRKSWFYSTTFGARRNDSEFHIGEDDTTLKFSDQQEENKLPLLYQANIGAYYKKFTFVFSQLYIPNRILMPKITAIVSW